MGSTEQKEIYFVYDHYDVSFIRAQARIIVSYIEMMTTNLNLPFRNTVTFVNKNVTDVISDLGTGKQVFATQIDEYFWARKTYGIFPSFDILGNLSPMMDSCLLISIEISNQLHPNALPGLQFQTNCTQMLYLVFDKHSYR